MSVYSTEEKRKKEKKCKRRTKNVRRKQLPILMTCRCVHERVHICLDRLFFESI